MRTITYGAVLAVPPERAFAVVADPTAWPRFFEAMVTAEVDPDWGRPGGHARMVNRFLGTAVRTEIEILEWEPARRFRYLGRQPGRPDMDNLRIFEEARLPGTAGPGTRLRASTTIILRTGAAGLVDRLSVRVLQRVFDRAMLRLPDVAADRQGRQPRR